MGKRHKPAAVTVRYADGASQQVRHDHFKRAPYWRSDRWKKKRRKVLQRDEGCVACHRNQGDKDPRLKAGRTTRLDVHHLTYERYGNERLEDLVTLCERCHSTEHAWLRRGRRA